MTIYYFYCDKCNGGGGMTPGEWESGLCPICYRPFSEELTEEEKNKRKAREKPWWKIW